MNKVFGVAEREKIKIDSGNSRQGLADRWRVIMKKCERSGKLYAAGIGVLIDPCD
ncbi:hypothetical protein [Pseudomonas sp. D3-10]|uniref:hypothetical protein n=1 Tax=Pseudomonas sp. D3-10 TaxID=2817392 RepID=UPI003DA8E982